MTPFTRFIAFDWTGARGERHRAIQGAEADAGDGAPRLLRPGHRWSRGEVLAFVREVAASGERALIGIDCSFSLPFVDRDAYFPGDTEPAGPRALWAEIDAVCAGEPDLAGHAYVEARRRHFWTGAADGAQKPFARLRVAEAIHRERRMGNPASPYVLVGASQVGKATLAGMRLLRRLADAMPVWPFDPCPKRGACLVEIYCQTFALDGGFRGKLRTKAALNAALAQLGSDLVSAEVPEQFDDHVGDALISAAGLRRVAAIPAYWAPPAMSEAVRRSEGWTFGIL
ncbi:MAG: hypothetical protein INF91_05555 [Alphaproteobacteria bacterium]|nr:hypothetical protein [Alphaproteobacteria bacterium]